MTVLPAITNSMRTNIYRYPDRTPIQTHETIYAIGSSSTGDLIFYIGRTHFKPQYRLGMHVRQARTLSSNPEWRAWVLEHEKELWIKSLDYVSKTEASVKEREAIIQAVSDGHPLLNQLKREQLYDPLPHAPVSYGGEYRVYAMGRVNTDVIVYIGVTGKTLRERRKKHLDMASSSSKRRKSLALAEWISEDPRGVRLVELFCTPDPVKAVEMERALIREGVAKGLPLLNKLHRGTRPLRIQEKRYRSVT